MSIGALLLLGLSTDVLARRLLLPRVTLLLLLGLLAGPSGLDLLPPARESWFDLSASIALVMIGFLLGAEFTSLQMRSLERTILKVAVFEAVVTAMIVGGGLALMGFPAELALPLAGIGAATAPAATLAVINDSGLHGRFVDVLKGVVAIDDVIGVVLFSLLAAATGVVVGGSLEWGPILRGLWELGGSVVLGFAIGLPASFLSGKLRGHEATLEEALALVLLCAGLALWFGLLPILSAMAMGATFASMASGHARPLHEIRSIEWPFLVVFFMLAGASVELGALGAAGWAVGAYVLLRTVGKQVGAFLGVQAAGEAKRIRLLGLALLPQSGVALGLALAARVRFPETGPRILTIVVAGTVVFELAGPVFTRFALSRQR